MTMEEREIYELTELIAKEEKTEKQLAEQLAECRRKKKDTVERKAMLLGNDFRDFNRKSIPDLLEILFCKYGEMYIKEASRLMESEFGRVVATQTISGALIRYTKKGKRFKELGRNIFDVVDREYQKWKSKEKNM